MTHLRIRGKKILIWGLFLLAFLSKMGFAGIGDWTTYTNMNYIHEVLLEGDRLWCATTGGVAVLDINDKSFTRLTNVDGLGGNYIFTLELDSAGNFWFGARNGTLTRYVPQEGLWKVYNFIDRDGSRLRIKDVVEDGGRLWIATNVGVSLFLIEKHGGEIKETYRHLGENLQVDEEVNAIHLAGERIWVGTARGVATANKDDPNLLDFSRWISFTTTTSPGLNNDSVYCIADIQGRIIIGTKQGVFEFDPSDSTWRSLGLGNRRVHDLEHFNQKIYSATDAGVYVYDGQIWEKLTTQGLSSSYFNSLTVGVDSTLWTGMAGGGVSVYDGYGWQSYSIDGPPANLFLDMEVDDKGNLWCAHEVYGASLFDKERWTSLSSIPQIGGHRINAVEKDKEGNIWFSSWGGGVIKYDGDTTWVRYTEENSPLKGVAANPAYVVVNDIAVDEAGNRWFPNWEARDSTRVVCSLRKEDVPWVVLYEQDGIASVLLQSVTAWKGHLYICTRDAGLLDYNYNRTPDNKDDDGVTHYTRQTHHLSDDAVMCAQVDKDGILWVGTSSGLDRFDPDFERFRTVPLPDPLGPQVNDIVVDERNNKWIATSNGLGMINSKGEFAGVFTTFNSKICGDNVLRIEIDEKTGDIWIGTDNGLSRFESGIGAPAEELSQVIPFPNPFIITNGTEVLTFDRLPYEAEVRIFTPAGELVKRIKSGNRWNGRNQAGELVASGVYLFHIQGIKGESAVGKIAVIRE